MLRSFLRSCPKLQNYGGIRPLRRIGYRGTKVVTSRRRSEEMNAIRNLTVQKQLRAAIAPPFLLFLPWRGRLKTMIPMVSVWCLFQMCVHAAAPNQPTFNSVPSPARLYPYTYPVVVNGPYRVVVDYTDPDGATDLQHVYLQLTGSGAAQTIMYQNMTTPVQWTGEGDHLYNITASKTAIANGYRVTFSFQIKSTWTPSSANVDFVAWGYDKSNVQGTSRTYDWNGTYDNNFRLVDARKTSLVDNDGDGYYSSVTIQADVGSELSSRNSEMLLYRR